MAQTEDSSVALQQIINKGIVNNPDTALKVARVLFANVYGIDELQRQEPLHILEDAGKWIVTGSYNSDRSKNGRGPARIEINSRDCKILKIYVEFINNLSEDAKRAIRRELEWNSRAHRE